MANTLLRGLRRVSLPSVLSFALPFRKILCSPEPIFILYRTSSHLPRNPKNCWQVVPLLQRRSFSHGSVNLVISPEGKPKFETHEIDPPKKEKWKTKKRLKLQRMREKQMRKAANKRDPRRLGVKGKKKRQRFSTPEERIKYKLENARIKENLLIERLKRYEVSKAQGPVVEPCVLSGEERFYMKKMAQKSSNYCPVGRRGIFGGVILNMHLHWKKHETVKVICKPCKSGQVQEYADEIARLSGGIPIQIIGDDTIVFYRGKNYVQPKVMSPVDTLSKKRYHPSSFLSPDSFGSLLRESWHHHAFCMVNLCHDMVVRTGWNLSGAKYFMKYVIAESDKSVHRQALEKSKYEQSLDSVRRFIAIAEKELELYYRHVALYGDPNDRDPKSILNQPRRKDGPNKNDLMKNSNSAAGDGLERCSSAVSGFVDQELSEVEDINIDNNESSDYEDDELLSEDLDSSDEILGTK